MGQKINPISLRMGVVKNWPARWLLKGNYGQFLEEDEAIRRVIKEKISQAGVSALEIERTSNNLRISIQAARPGFIIGRGGKGIEDLTKAIEKALRAVRARRKNTGKAPQLSVNVEELKRSQIAAPYVAQQIAWDLEKRFPFRRTMKKYLEQIMQNREVKGAKIFLSGRLDGNEIARREWLAKGSLPLQTLRADIDFGQATAFTSYGTVGIKVWIYKGEIFEEKPKEEMPAKREHRGGRREH
ncbi:MAG: 30S ribosomal protein S3 [Candidatus Liptonbacteria bacterium]|nr:30S ribosomal protein S3 [Candidatus Liptonbacteria bacterium]